MKILLIDDEPDVLEFQKAYLKRHNYDVFTASSKKEAVEELKKNFPDIVFCDIRIDSDSTGLELLKYAKEISKKIEFYLVTGFLEEEVREKGISLGAKEVLIKPLTNEAIEKRIIEFVKEGQCILKN